MTKVMDLITNPSREGGFVTELTRLFGKDQVAELRKQVLRDLPPGLGIDQPANETSSTKPRIYWHPPNPIPGIAIHSPGFFEKGVPHVGNYRTIPRVPRPARGAISVLMGPLARDLLQDEGDDPNALNQP